MKIAEIVPWISLYIWAVVSVFHRLHIVGGPELEEKIHEQASIHWIRSEHERDHLPASPGITDTLFFSGYQITMFPIAFMRVEVVIKL